MSKQKKQIGNCNGCAYFDGFGLDDYIGSCIFNPPVIVSRLLKKDEYGDLDQSSVDGACIFPTVAASNHCGNFLSVKEVEWIE